MRSLLSYLLVTGLVAVISASDAQDVPIGQWKDYLSYQSNLKVCQGQNTIYCTSQSGIFSYNLGDNSLERFNKITGLSDLSPSVARFSTYNNSLVIGYQDGNIDVLQANQVTNMPDLYTASVEGSKVINDIYFYNNFAYISCGQGILQMDLSQDIIMNTYNVSSTGNAVNVFGITIFQDTIFAATAEGVYKGYLYDPNLNDYADWIKVTSTVLPKGQFNAITTFNNQVLVNYSSSLTTGSGGHDTIYTYNGAAWSHFKYVQGSTGVNTLESCNNYLVIANYYDVEVIDMSNNMDIDINNYGTYAPQASDAIIDANMNVWIADAAHGLVKSTANFNGISIYPPGPFSNYVTGMQIAGGNIWITPGGYNQSKGNEYIKVGVSTYQNGNWYRIVDEPNDTLFDINCVVVDPNNPAHAFAGSWGNGVVEYKGNQIAKLYNPGNSSLESVDLAGYYSVRVGGMAYDTLGNLWVTNSLDTSHYLSVMKTDGTWQSFNFNAFIAPKQTVLQLLVTKSNAKWILAPGTGILVYQDNGTFAQPNSSNTILITAATGHGALPDLGVTSIAQDMNGTVWVGTDMQVVAFYTPDNVLDGNSDWDAQPIYVNQNGYTQYLMQSQTTTAIAIDGANRKWLGTGGGGVFLMSSDGTQQVYNFTSQNSPLLSNNINCIAINQSNGEVFFATDQGIVSFRSTATEGNSTFTNVYAFPNPVPHDYDGVVAIKGLVANSDVKITTANGELVYHTIALGGQAIWNGTNFNGVRVQTGVYLVFCSSPDGSQSYVTKLLFLN